MNSLFNRVLYKSYRITKNNLSNFKNCNVFLIGTPEHGNLGDHLISLATIKFLKEHKINFAEIPVSMYPKMKSKIVDSNKTLLLLQGGGNFGNEYIDDDDIRLDVAENFKNSNIIIMPQTIYYNSAPDAQERLEKTQKLFSSHTHLTLCAREQISFQKMKEYFPKNEVLLVPDIVLSSDISTSDTKKKQVLFLLRRDLEKVENTNYIEKIKTWAKNNNFECVFSDTVIDCNTNILNRKRKIKKLFKLIVNSQLIVTDRLHGMISAYINNIPAIVFPNYNHKIISSFEWVKNGKVKLFDDNLDIDKLINSTQNNPSLKENFKELENVIEKILNRR